MAHTLLLADDSVTIQRVIELTFAEEDIAVVVFSNGDDAIRSMHQSRPDIVLADIGMPGKSGYEVAQHMKGNPTLAAVPVLLLTGAFEPVDNARMSDIGCAGILTKPFDPREVVHRVKALLGHTELAKAPLQTPPASVPKVAASTNPTDALDDYFERLDQAITARVEEPLRRPMAPVPAASPPAEPEPIIANNAPLSNAFAALLSAERSGADPFPLASWGSQPEPEASRATDISDDVIEAITLRVLDRLAGRMQDTVRDVASSTAERLVREEIDRIKRNIK